MKTTSRFILKFCLCLKVNKQTKLQFNRFVYKMTLICFNNKYVKLRLFVYIKLTADY